MQSDQLRITLHFVGIIASQNPPKTGVSNTMDRSGISEETLRDHFSRALSQTHAEILVSGSMAELPLTYVFKNITDIDLMEIPTDIVALEIDDYLIFQGREQPVVIISSDSSPGLVYLVSPYKGDLVCDYNTQIVMDFRKGPSLKRAYILDSTIASALKINTVLYEAISDFSLDKVFSIKCPKWPNSAKEVDNSSKVEWLAFE